MKFLPSFLLMNSTVHWTGYICIKLCGVVQTNGAVHWTTQVHLHLAPMVPKPVVQYVSKILSTKLLTLCVELTNTFAPSSEMWPTNHMVHFTNLVQSMWSLNPWYRCVVLSIFASSTENRSVNQFSCVAPSKLAFSSEIRYTYIAP